MENTELLNVLEDSAYLIKQYANTCTDVQKQLPLRVYGKLLRAIIDLKPTQDKNVLELEKQVIEDGIIHNTEEEQPQETSESKASILLLESGLFVDKQLRHPNNQRFLKECDAFIEEYGQERFKTVLARVKLRTSKTKVNNLYGYVRNALANESKQGVKQ